VPTAPVHYMPRPTRSLSVVLCVCCITACFEYVYAVPEGWRVKEIGASYYGAPLIVAKGTTSVTECAELCDFNLYQEAVRGGEACHAFFTDDLGGGVINCYLILSQDWKYGDTQNPGRTPNLISTTYERLENPIPVACPAGKYKSDVGVGVCIDCPPYKTDCICNVGYTSVGVGLGISTDCICNVGYTGSDDGNCVACEVGTYKDTTGSAACTPDGWKVVHIGYIYFPYELAGQYDASACAGLCDDKLYEFGGYDRTACFAFFTWLDANGQTLCHIISAQDWDHGKSDGPSTTGQYAMDGATTYERLEHPGCLAGTTGPVGFCTECSEGTYKPTVGSATCTSCPLYSNIPAASPGVLIDGNACRCNAGYSGPDGGTCTACEGGNYKSTQGSASCIKCSAGKYSAGSANSQCTSCAAGTYSTEYGATHPDTCQNCPVNTNSLAGSYDMYRCTCNPGWSGLDGGPCTQCAEGKFSQRSEVVSECIGIFDSIQLVACRLGGQNSLYDDQTSTTLRQTLPISDGPTDAPISPSGPCCRVEVFHDGEWGTVCSNGDWGVEEAQVVCANLGCQGVASGISNFGGGLGKNWIENVECVGTEDYITQCNGEWGEDNCQHDMDAGVCCEGVSVSTGSCQYSTDNQCQLCQTCPSDSNSPATSHDISDCTCNRGYEYSDTSCTVCDDGMYKDMVSNDECTLCTPGKYTDSFVPFTSCYETTTGESCSAGQYVSATSPGSVSCEDCPIGQYSTGGMYPVPSRFITDDSGTRIRNASECLRCPSTRTTISTKSKSRDDCICKPGSYIDFAPVMRRLLYSEFDCTKCPANTFQSTAGQSSCIACPVAQYTTGGASTCTNCEIGSYGVNTGEGCRDCPRGTFGISAGATSCVQCKACPDNMYRVNCTTENALMNIDSEAIGICISCPSCNDRNKVRVGCVNNAGNNDAAGHCIEREYAVQAPVCPRREVYPSNTGGVISVKKSYTKQVGLGGYTFRDVFGMDFNDASVPFQCRRQCDGLPRDDIDEMDEVDKDPVPGMRDSGTCAGPFACNIAACTMLSSFDDVSMTTDYQLPRACPVAGSPGEDVTFPATLSSEDDDPYFKQRIGQKCQTCRECGDPQLNNMNIPGYGRGCAAECTRLVCEELNTIFDWTDGFPEYDTFLADEERPLLLRCKLCSELRDARLCATDDLFAASDVSGNRPLMHFDGCKGLQSQATIENPDVTPQYGACELCEVSAFACGVQEYPDSCPAQQHTCAACMGRGVQGVHVHTEQGRYYNSSGALLSLYCQLRCVQGWTGVQESNKVEPAVCARRCAAPRVCAASEFPLPCSVPHEARCVPRHPVDDHQRNVVGMIPAHANMLETPVSVAGHGLMFTSFENVFIDLGEQEDHLHQCVWNAVDVRDNDKTPGGVSYTFWRPGYAYAFPLTSLGSKWCQWTRHGESNSWSEWAFDRDKDVRYPLLPLQNVVAGAEPRRLLINTSARAMRYCEGLGAGDVGCVGGYNGEGTGGTGGQRALLRGAARARVGDLYLGLEMWHARNATVHLTLPDRRFPAWVPRWWFAVLATDATQGGKATFTTRVEPLSGEDQPTLGESEVLVDFAAIQLDYLLPEVSPEPFDTRRWWSSDTRPYVFCLTNTSKTLYVAPALDDAEYSLAPPYNIGGLKDQFPALVFGDLRSGTGVLRHPITSKPTTASPPTAHTALRTAVHSDTCIAYFSTVRSVYCVHLDLSSSEIHEFPVGKVVDFVVVSHEDKDYLLVHRTDVLTSRFVLQRTDSDSLTRPLPEAVGTNAAMVLQVASNGSAVVAVRQVAGRLWLHVSGVQNCMDGGCASVTLAGETSNQTDLDANTVFTAEDVVLAVSPHGVVLLVVLHPSSECLWVLFYDSSGAVLATVRQDAPEPIEALGGRGEQSASVAWVDEETVLLARRGAVCEATRHGQNAALACGDRPELDNRRFSQILGGAVVLGDDGLQLLAPAPVGMLRVSAPNNCVAGFHAFVEGIGMMTLEQGPLYILDGRAQQILQDVTAQYTPDSVYDSNGTRVAAVPTQILSIPTAPDEIGYHFTITCRCAERSRWADPWNLGSYTLETGTLACDESMLLQVEVRAHARVRFWGGPWNTMCESADTCQVNLIAGCRVSPVVRGLFDDAMPPLPLDRIWSTVQHTIRAAVLQNSTALAVHFERGQEPGNRHEVLALDALELLVDLVKGQDRGVLTLHVPSEAELETIDLPTALRGSDITDWRRMHVTVRSAANCALRVRIVSPALNAALPHVGCAGEGECQLEVPLADVENNVARLNVTGDCVDRGVKLGVVLQPMTTMHECGSNEFFSVDSGQCMSCDETNDLTLNTSAQCPPGRYVHGCDMLRHESDRECRPCAWPAPGMNETALWVAGICQLACRDGYYRAAADSCVACTTEKQYSCARNAGSRWQSCTTDAQEQCVSCPAIQKGQASINEVFVANTSCLTRCKPGYYRHNASPYACLRCTPYASMLLVAQLEETRTLVPVTESRYARFQQCTETSDAISIPCSKQGDTILGHALDFGLDCPRSCTDDRHLQIETQVLPTAASYSALFTATLLELQTSVVRHHSWQMYRCVVCDKVLSPDSTPLPATAHWFVPGCDYHCNQSAGYFRRNSSVTWPIGQCLIQQTCEVQLDSVDLMASPQQCINVKAARTIPEQHTPPAVDTSIIIEAGQVDFELDFYTYQTACVEPDTSDKPRIQPMDTDGRLKVQISPTWFVGGCVPIVVLSVLDETQKTDYMMLSPMTEVREFVLGPETGLYKKLQSIPFALSCEGDPCVSNAFTWTTAARYQVTLMHIIQKRVLYPWLATTSISSQTYPENSFGWTCHNVENVFNTNALQGTFTAAATRLQDYSTCLYTISIDGFNENERTWRQGLETFQYHANMQISVTTINTSGYAPPPDSIRYSLNKVTVYNCQDHSQCEIIMYAQHSINFTTTIDTGYVQLAFYMPGGWIDKLLEYKVDWQIVRPTVNPFQTVTSLNQFPWNSSGHASSAIVTPMKKSSPPHSIVATVTMHSTTISWMPPENHGYDVVVDEAAPVVYYLLETREAGCNVTLERERCDISSTICDFEARVLTLSPVEFDMEFRIIAGTHVGDGEPSAWQRVESSVFTNFTRTCSYCGTYSDGLCKVGEYPVGDCTRCAACTGGLRGVWNFTSAGVVDDPASCGQACAAGWFRDWFSEECRPHTQPACGADQYLLAGTPTSDAFCAQCRSCAGMRRTRACNSTSDGKCQACAAPAPGLLWLHENCTAACAPGYVWNVRTERCEACDVACAPGSRPPAARHNCTHCAACPAAPLGATFTRGCSWSCGPDQTVQGEGPARQCTDLLSLQQREPATPAPTASACAEHQKLETVSFKAARCVDCDVVTPSDDSTWTWTKLAGTCSWACNAGLYKYFRTGVLGAPSVDAAGHRHVDCVAWPVYAALSRDPSQPITLAETQQYFAGRAVAGARALRAGLGFLLSLILTAVVIR